MKKLIPIIIIGVFLASGLGAAAFSSNVSLKQASSTAKNISLSVPFSSQPTFVEKDGFLTVEMTGTTTKLQSKNQPVLPIYVKTYEIPFGSTNIQVTCSPSDIRSLEISAPITPARIAPLSELSEQTPYVMDESVYRSAALYPDSWYNSDLGAGRNGNGVEVTFVKVVCYPVRYSPLNNEVTYAGSFDVSITYDAPTTPAKIFDTHFDMVVIAPEAFHAKLQPLIDEKNASGIVTTFKSMEDILAEYNGTDPPEQVKYFIKDAYDNWNITYVLLAGGLKNHIFAKDKDTISAGWKAWWVPVRYVSIPYSEDEGCLSDLYYGCLYNATGGFDSWDSNGDGVYAAWGMPGFQRDLFDMNPEVYVSRLPVANKVELDRIVKKIITYESTGPAAKPWYKNFVGVGGKTFSYWAGEPDGEYLCELAYNYTKLAIPDLKLVKVFTTNRDIGGLVPDIKGVSTAFNQGAGFVDFEGHGGPSRWDTNWFDANGTDRVGINIGQFMRIRNGDMQPVVVVGGCHNGLYNITILAAMIDIKGTTHFGYGYPIPVCFSWGLVIKPIGGAIASTGCTGYGLGGGGNPVAFSGELEMNFFYEIGNGSTNLAQAHSRAIQKYIAEETIGSSDAFCITNWALFGDPSLKLGGYSS
jgi:hypothetical protein